MVTDADGQIGTAIRLQDAASKGRSGRVIPINRNLRNALVALQASPGGRRSPFVVTTERAGATSPQAIVNLFARWYGALGVNRHAIGRRLTVCSTCSDLCLGHDPAP